LLSLQLHNGDGLSSVLLGLKRIFLNQWMRGQELANPPAECACSVPVNNSDARLARQRGIVQKFVQAIGGFFHSHADHVDFVIAADLPALRSHRHALQLSRRRTRFRSEERRVGKGARWRYAW